MQKFTGWQYLLIDCANHYGLDKEAYSSRIKWAEAHLDELESLLDDLLGQLYKTEGSFPKKSTDLASYIRKSNYAIC
jgi:DNA-directed RNA polymerase